MLQKKIVWKLNIIDLLLLTIILLSLIALIYKSVWGKQTAEYKPYSMTFVCESTPIELLDKVNSDETCIDGLLGAELGVVTSINSTPIFDNSSSIYSENFLNSNDNDNGQTNNNRQLSQTPTPRPSAEPVRARATFVVSVEGAQTEHGVRVEQSVYLMGQTTQIVIGDTIFDVYLSDIK